MSRLLFVGTGRILDPTQGEHFPKTWFTVVVADVDVVVELFHSRHTFDDVFYFLVVSKKIHSMPLPLLEDKICHQIMIAY